MYSGQEHVMEDAEARRSGSSGLSERSLRRTREYLDSALRLCVIFIWHLRVITVALQQFGVSAGGGRRSFSAFHVPPSPVFSACCVPPCSTRPHLVYVELSTVRFTTRWKAHGISSMAENRSIGGWTTRLLVETRKELTTRYTVRRTPYYTLYEVRFIL